VIPSTLLGLLLFIVLLAPGLAYALRHERVVPAPAHSAFRETLRVIFVSVACLTVTSLMFAVLRWFLPGRTPNVRGLIRDPNDFARDHHVHLIWWSVGLIAFATLLGAFFADPRIVAKRRQWRSSWFAIKVFGGSPKLAGVEVSTCLSGGGGSCSQSLVDGVTEAVGVAGDCLDRSVGSFRAGVGDAGV
jgi:hypothetical protein